MDLLAWMERWNMLPDKGGIILCALSGGRDSVCLLHYLKELAPGRGFSVAAAHFNHQMRPTAERDEAFARELCREWGIPFYCGHGDVCAAAEEHGWSGEEAARRLRYDFLEQTAREIGAAKIATAHHLSDQAETVVLNLLRGTGAEGLCGIPPVRGKLIRPLLQTARQEIEDYLAANALPYVDDESNGEDCFARNRLRLRVWPELERIHSGAAENIARTAQLLRGENEYLNDLAASYLPDEGTALDCTKLLSAPEALRGRILRLLVTRTQAGRKDFGAVHYDALLRLAQNGGMLDLPGGVRAVCREGTLRLEHRPDTLLPKVLHEQTDWGEYTIWQRKVRGNFSEKDDTILLNCGKINQVVQVRPFCAADRLTLPGSRGSRSVKRLLSERGIPQEERQRLPVFCVGERLAAVYGIGTDVDFLPQDGSEVIEIIVKKNVWEDSTNG
ncbi:MAG: tRNA lysidine(34) synthetase TilS [Clostridiales bacterium]|nr:tRNA lysidine(34) synthetase TilS [Candidatus Cacconaster stercorequi]